MLWPCENPPSWNPADCATTTTAPTTTTSPPTTQPAPSTTTAPPVTQPPATTATTAVPRPTPTVQLARTGIDTWTLLILAVALLIGGALAMLTPRR